MEKPINIPNVINFSDMLENDFSFSILDYKQFNFPNTNCLLLGTICSIEQGTFVDNIDRTKYDTGLSYITIRDFEGYVFSKKNNDYIIPKSAYSFLKIDKSTIFVSDAGSIGKATFVKNEINGINADGITRINYLNNSIVDIYYIFACIQNPYFTELLKTIAPSGSTQQNVEVKHFKKTFIPIPNKNINETIKYVSLLMQAVINKEMIALQKHKNISSIIEKELLQNQTNNAFLYEMPRIKEVEEFGRLDTGVYSEQFKEIQHKIKNYSGGYFHIDSHKIKSGSTPNTRHISSDSSLKYMWVTPTACSDCGLLTEERIIFKGTNNINQDCILLINRTSKGGIGEYVGIAGFYNLTDFGNGQHNQGMYQVFDYEKEKLLFMLCFLNTPLMRKYCAALSVGSKMKELKMEHFLQIPFPSFPEEKQKEIVKLYHNSAIGYQAKDCTLDDFLEFDNKYNQNAGIYELDKTAKQLKTKLNLVINNIVNDKLVNIDFT